MSTQNVNARNVEWNFFCNFQTMCSETFWLFSTTVSSFLVARVDFHLLNRKDLSVGALFLVLTHVLGQKRIRCLGEDLRSAWKKRFSVLLLLLSMIHQRRICSISIISLRSSASALLLVTVDGSHQISRVASEGDTNLASYSDSTTSFELQFGALKNGYAYSINNRSY